MLRIEGLAAFVAVAEGGSISEAARRLRLSKSVVSERLADLERSLGGALVHRSTRRLTLTEDGGAFLDRARHILHEVTEAAADMAERRGTLSGALRIAAPVTFGRMHLGPALYPFLAEHPAIELTLDLDDRRVDATSGGYDAIIRHGPIADSRLVVWTLAPSRRYLVAAPDYLDRHGTPKTLEDLETHRSMSYAYRGIADWLFETPAGGISVRAKVALRSNNGDMLRDAAISGLGIALLPGFIVGEALRDGSLVAIDIGVQPAAEFIYMAHPAGRTPSAKLRAIVEHLRARFGNPPYWDPPTS